MDGWLGRKLQCCNYPFLTGNLYSYASVTSLTSYYEEKSVFLRKIVNQSPALSWVDVSRSCVNESKLH